VERVTRSALRRALKRNPHDRRERVPFNYAALQRYEHYGLVQTTRSAMAPPTWPPPDEVVEEEGFATVIRPGPGWERPPALRRRTPGSEPEPLLLTQEERLREAVRLGGTVRSLARRALRLHRRNEFPVPTEGLLVATQDVARTMPKPEHKLARVRRAYTRWAVYINRQLAQQGRLRRPGQPGLIAGPPPASVWYPVRRTDENGGREAWPDLLADAHAERLFRPAVDHAYYVVEHALPWFAGGARADLSAIPFEEQVVLVTIYELADKLKRKRG
jgi:hypothetical protein